MCAKEILMNKKNILLGIAGLLIVIGLVKPDLSAWINKTNPAVDTVVVISPPSDAKLRDACGPVIDALRAGDNNRTKDGKRLSSLYLDMATLIELDGEDQCVRTTDDVRYANSLSGPMLKMDIKGKYPSLAKNATAVIVAGIGDDNVPLDPELRAKAADSFKALAWACNEGAK